MLVYQLALLLVLLPLCSFAPGFFFVRKLRWNPLEKLCGSIGLSLILIYLASWGIYCAGARGDRMPVHPLPFALVSLVCAALAAFSWKDAVRLFQTPVVRHALAGLGFLLLWTAVLNAIIRNFSGAGWFGDWMEHFQRSLYFLDHFPTKTEIFPGYILPARPPMMNVLSAFFLAQTADRFETFQAIFGFLNSLLFLPCYLIMPALAVKARRRTWPLVLLFAASPLIMENTTYTWTKEGAAFYIVTALWFYLAGWRKGDSVRIAAAFVSLAAGLLVHYSAGPYIAIISLHYLLRVWPRRPNKWRELAYIAVLCGLLVGTWLAWSMAVFGPHDTLASNSSVTSSQQYQGDTAGKIFDNLYYTIVPVIVRQPSLLNRFDAQRSAGTLRDCFFIFYQVNAIFAMGLVGGPLALFLIFRALRGRRPRAPERKKRPVKVKERLPATPEQVFWRILLVAGLLLGVAVVGEHDEMGVGHLTLLSLQAVGLAMIAAVIPWRRGTLLALILAGCAVDFSFGVLLHAHVEGLDNGAANEVFPWVDFTGGRIASVPPGLDALSTSAWGNWFTKHHMAVFDWWLADMTRKYGADPAFQATMPAYDVQINKVRADDQRMYQGWFTRHGGEVTFLADHLAPWSAVFQVLLVAMFAGLVGAVWRAA